MTMQTFLAGLYPPADWSKWDSLNWQPIPIGINDELLRAYNIDDCTAQKDAWKPVENAETPEGKKLYDNNKVMVNN